MAHGGPAAAGGGNLLPGLGGGGPGRIQLVLGLLDSAGDQRTQSGQRRARRVTDAIKGGSEGGGRRLGAGGAGGQLVERRSTLVTQGAEGAGAGFLKLVQPVADETGHHLLPGLVDRAIVGGLKRGVEPGTGNRDDIAVVLPDIVGQAHGRSEVLLVAVIQRGAEFGGLLARGLVALGQFLSHHRILLGQRRTHHLQRGLAAGFLDTLVLLPEPPLQFNSRREAVLGDAIGLIKDRLGGVGILLLGVAQSLGDLIPCHRQRGKLLLVGSEIAGETLTGREHAIERQLLRPVVRARDVHRYQTITARTWMILPYQDGRLLTEDELRSRYPGAWAYLGENKETLSSRSRGNGPWYAPSSVNRRFFGKEPKLLTGWRQGPAQFTLDETGDILFTGSSRTAAVVPTTPDIPIAALLGILNSDSIWKVAATTGKEYQGGLAWSASVLDQIPIVPVTGQTRPLYEAIAAKVRAILPLPVEAVAARESLENDIDRLVEQLYGIESRTR